MAGQNIVKGWIKKLIEDCLRQFTVYFYLVASCYSVLNPVVRLSLTKSHICVAVSGIVSYVSGVARQQYPSALREFNNHSSLTDVRNIALRLKYFNMFEIPVKLWLSALNGIG